MQDLCVNLGRFLSARGHGKGLFDTLSNFRPDIVIMDIYLGDSDGRNLCQQLKTSTDFKNIPIILYSAGIITKESIEQSMADEFIVNFNPSI